MKGNKSGAIFLFSLAVVGIIALARNANNTPGGPAATQQYTDGPVTIYVSNITGNGFSYAVLVNGVQEFADTVNAGDATYSIKTADGKYVVVYTPNANNTTANFLVYDVATQAQVSTAGVTINFANGLKA